MATGIQSTRRRGSFIKASHLHFKLDAVVIRKNHMVTNRKVQGLAVLWCEWFVAVMLCGDSFGPFPMAAHDAAPATL